MNFPVHRRLAERPFAEEFFSPNSPRWGFSIAFEIPLSKFFERALKIPATFS